MTEWINNKFGTNFSDADLASIKDFSLIWNVFENIICNNSFSIAKVERQIANRSFEINLFQNIFDYFKDRYVLNGDFTSKFSYMYFRSGDRKELVEQVLIGNNICTNDIILSITIIVYRFRCNLTHGLKNIQDIDQQRENFKIANLFLTTFIDNF